MKTSICLFLSILLLSGFSPPNPDCTWIRELSPGMGRFQEQWEPGTWPMALSLITSNEETLVIPGDKLLWTSADGLRWTAIAKTNWGTRHGAAYTRFKNQYIMTGGMRSWGTFYHDTWISQDGKSWVQYQSPWIARRGHAMIEFKGKLWLIGGMISSGKDDELPSQHLRDIWSTEDGIHWMEELPQGSWTDNGEFIVQVFKNQLFMIRLTGSVWVSHDGKNWNQILDVAPWCPRQNAGGLVFAENLWVFGGMGLRDVWRSPDGKRWTRQTAAAPWSARTTTHSVVFRKKLWIFSGKTGKNDSWSGDIWTLSDCDGN